MIVSAAGLALLSVAVLFSLLHGHTMASIVPQVEVVSGLVFYLYGKTSSQLSAFHSRIEVLQRHPLANTICERLDG